MTRKLLLILLPLLLLVFVPIANGETTTTRSASTINPENDAIATDAATKLKLQMKLIQDQKKEELSKIKEEAQALILAKRSEFKAKLQLIKDQNKKLLVERIDTKLAEVNKKHTARFSEVLVKLQGFVDKAKLSSASATMQADIVAAQAAIDTAKAAVDIQAAKTYTITIASEATLKINVGATVSLLRKDLMAVYKLVVDAKQAVQKLNTDKATIKKEATGSAEL